MGALMQALLASRPIFQATSIQPNKGSVEKMEYKAGDIANWSRAAKSIHATTAILTAPVWGSTKPNDFITISGKAPINAPVVIRVPSVAGSNTPQGGTINV